MDIIALISLIGGFVIMVVGILWGGADIMLFYDESSLFITIGGMIFSVLASYPFKSVATALKAFPIILKKQKLDLNGAIKTIIELANSARKEGLLFLEDSVKELGDPFLQKGILLIVDGNDPELVKGILETDLSYMEERHNLVKEVYEAFATYGPAFGMIGTLIGLINMLSNLSDPSTLGPSMSIALITTMYGCIVANVIFSPAANKLYKLSQEEVLYKTILIEGMLSIQAGENPRIIEEKLMSFLPFNAEAKAEETDDREANNLG